MKKSKNRREFLLKLMGVGVGIGLTGEVKSSQKPIKMLDADGNLVEIDPEVIENAEKVKAKNSEILSWSKAIKK